MALNVRDQSRRIRLTAWVLGISPKRLAQAVGIEDEYAALFRRRAMPVEATEKLCSWLEVPRATWEAEEYVYVSAIRGRALQMA